MSDDRMFPSERDLDAFWNALVRGEDRLDAAGPERDDADQLRRLHSLLHAQPPAGADERLRRGVMAELARRRLRSNGMEPSMNGLALGAPPIAPLIPPRPIVIRPARPLRQPRWERSASLIGVAALIVAMIGGIFFIYRGSHENQLPAIVASPSAVATPAGAAGDWPMARGNPARTGAVDQPGPTGPFGVRWTFKAPIALNAPMVAGGTVYVASEGGGVYATNAATGQQRWAFDMGSAAQDDTNYPSPTVGPNLVYAAATNGTLYALDRADGTVRWSYKTAAQVIATPTLVGDTLYVDDQSGTLHALDASSGAVRWTASLGQPLPAGPAVADGILYQVDAVGKLYALDANSGAVRWSVPFTAFTRAPAVSGGLAYLGSNDGHLYALDAKTGTQRWRYTAPSGASVNNASIAGGIVVVNVEGVGTVALDAASGRQVWNAAFDAGGRPPVLAAGVAYVVDATSQVLAFDLATGHQVGGGTVAGTPENMAVAGGALYLGDSSGTLTAFVTGAATPVSQVAVAPTPAAQAGPTQTVQASPAPASTGVQATQLWTARLAQSPGAAIAFAPDGTVWVQDYAGTAWIFDRDGNLLGKWGTPGTGPGQLNFKVAGEDSWFGDLAFAPDGSFFIAECGNSRVEKFDAQRKLVLTIGTKGSSAGQLMCPSGVAVGADGDIFVADNGRNDIQRFGPDGTYIKNLGSFAYPTDLATDRSGNLVFGEINAQRVRVITPDGKSILSFGSPGDGPGHLQWPNEIAVDGAGNFFVSDGRVPYVSVFDSTGAFLGTIGSAGSGDGQFGPGITAVAYGGNGSLYVSDIGTDASGDFRIQKFKVMVTAPAASSATPTP